MKRITISVIGLLSLALTASADILYWGGTGIGGGGTSGILTGSFTIVGSGYISNNAAAGGSNIVSLTTAASNAMNLAIAGNGSLIKSNISLDLVTATSHTTTNGIQLPFLFADDGQVAIIVSNRSLWGWDDGGLVSTEVAYWEDTGFYLTNSLYVNGLAYFYNPVQFRSNTTFFVLPSVTNTATPANSGVPITNSTGVLPPSPVAVGTATNCINCITNATGPGISLSGTGNNTLTLSTNGWNMGAGTTILGTNLNLLCGCSSAATVDESVCASYLFTNALQGALTVVVQGQTPGGYASISGLATNAHTVTFNFGNSSTNMQAGGFPFSPTNNFDALMQCVSVNPTNHRVYLRQAP